MPNSFPPPLSYYDFEESDPTTVLDQGTAGNHGEIVDPFNDTIARVASGGIYAQAGEGTRCLEWIEQNAFGFLGYTRRSRFPWCRVPTGEESWWEQSKAIPVCASISVTTLRSSRRASWSRIRGTSRFVAGADPRGTLYGVYALLEKLGCGFYLSYDALPSPRKGRVSFAGWEMSDAPVVADRGVLNWHNFLSSASTWELEDWQHYI